MKRLFIASLLAFAPFTWALDQAGSQRLSDLQQRWAQIQYQMPKDNACRRLRKAGRRRSGVRSSVPRHT
jgi:hypothetical protein